MEEEDNRGLKWDKPFYTYFGKPFVPIIYEGSIDKVPERFNAIVIQLDGRMRADLAWNEAKQVAFEAIQKGLFILWEIDLGILSQLPFPLDHQSQYAALRLSLEHFRDAIWKEYHEHSLGVSLYKGTGDFSAHFQWNDSYVENLKEWEKERSSEIDVLSIFCREVVVEYIALLSSCLPDTILKYLEIEIPEGSDLLWEAQVFDPEAFEQFNLIIKNGSLPLQGIGWGKSLPWGYCGSVLPLFNGREEEKVGLCLPAQNKYNIQVCYELEKILKGLMSSKVSFRLISEDHLTTEWDGLDEIIYIEKGLSGQGRRKLQGFTAAGGTVRPVEVS